MPVSGTPREIIHEEMGRYKRGQLHSGPDKYGHFAKGRKQAIAIALSEARKHGRVHRDMGGFTRADQQAPSTPQPASFPPGMGGGLAASGLGASAYPPPSGFSSASAPSPAPISGFGVNSVAAPPSGWISPPATSAMPQPSPSTGPNPPPNPPAPTAVGAATPPPASNAGPFGDTFRVNRQFGGGMTRPPAASWMVRNEARSMLHSGPISSVVPGRTDRHNVRVGSGAYVMPADAVSHLGQNNTKAGQAILGHMFGGQGPYGMGKDMAVRHGPGAPKPPSLPRQTGMPHLPKFQSAGGGKGDRTGEPVPIVVAGGEFTIPPEAVAAVGGGDIKRGHKVLDSWVLSIRKKHIATLKGLPPPAKA